MFIVEARKMQGVKVKTSPSLKSAPLNKSNCIDRGRVYYTFINVKNAV